MESTYQLRKIGDLDVFFRNPKVERTWKAAVKFLTNEDFEDFFEGKYKRKLKILKSLETILILILISMIMKKIFVYVLRILVLI